MDDLRRGPIGRLVASLSRLLATILTIGRSRLELLTVELQLEVQRIAELALWAFVAVFASGVALLLSGIAVILVFWDTNRLLAAALVTGIFLAAALISIFVLLRKLRARPRMLDGTLAELTRDIERLDGRE